MWWLLQPPPEIPPYWRESPLMEGDTHLLRVIKELRSEINKLEKENKELKGELSQIGHDTISSKEREPRAAIKCDQAQKKEVKCKGLLRRNVSVQSADLLQEQTGIVQSFHLP